MDRWANHNRYSQPLTRGYLGNPEDVVISLSSFTGELDYFQWESGYHQNQDMITDGLANTLFAYELGNSIPFRIDLHFSDEIQGSGWFVSQFSLYLGDELCVNLVINDFNRFSSECVLKLNKSHLVYSLLDSFFPKGIDSLVMEDMRENSVDKNFLTFTSIDSSGELAWRKPISWLEADNGVERPTPDVLELRTFLLSLLTIPTKSISSTSPSK